MSRLPKALICHPWMGLAGSEIVVAWILEALRGRFELHLCTAGGFAPEHWNNAAGTSLHADEIHWIKAPRLPGAKSESSLPYLHRGRFEQFCRSIASGYDLCISGYNPIRFGRPAVHVIGDSTWHDHLLGPGKLDRRHMKAAATGALRSLYRGVVNGFFFVPPERGFSEHDYFLSNSHWTLEQHLKLVPQVRHEVVYPPAPLSANEAWSRKDPGSRRSFASLGRVAKEKRIEEQIEILERVRACGEDVTLTIIGGAGDDAYGQRIREMAAARREWVTLAGAKYGSDKTALLRGIEFGIHTRRDEAFGIAVAELASLGCPTWVAESSGSTEIVPDQAFHFGTVDDAVTRVIRVLRAPREEVEAIRQRIRDHVVGNFLPEVFVRRIQEEVDAFLSGKPPLVRGERLPAMVDHAWKGGAAVHETALD